jgi:hypothetical protein
MTNGTTKIFIIDTYPNQTVLEKTFKISEIEKIIETGDEISLLVSGLGHFDHSEQCKVADWVRGFITREAAVKVYKNMRSATLKHEIDSAKQKLNELKNYV